MAVVVTGGVRRRGAISPGMYDSVKRPEPTVTVGHLQMRCGPAARQAEEEEQALAEQGAPTPAAPGRHGCR